MLKNKSSGAAEGKIQKKEFSDWLSDLYGELCEDSAARDKSRTAAQPTSTHRSFFVILFFDDGEASVEKV